MKEVNRLSPLYFKARVQIELSCVDPTYGRFSGGTIATVPIHERDAPSSMTIDSVVRVNACPIVTGIGLATCPRCV